MSNTSAKTGTGHGPGAAPPPRPAPPRPAQFGSKPPAYEKATQRLSAGRTLRKSVLQAASALGGGGETGIRDYLIHLGGSTSASDRSAFIGLLSRILPKNVEMSGEVTTGVTIKLPWLEQSRAVDAIATPPPAGLVIDQTTETIDEK